MTVEEIVKNYLKKNNYDGLCCDVCECNLQDLMDCDYENMKECKAAEQVPCELCKKKDFLVKGVSGYCMQAI